MKSVRSFLLLLIAWVFSLPAAQPSRMTDQGWFEYQDTVNDLVFLAYAFPEDSYEIRMLLAELMGYDGSQVLTQQEDWELDDFEQAVGRPPSQLPVLELELVLRTTHRDGSQSIEYQRSWLRLSDGEIVHRFVGARATAAGEVDNEAALEAVWNHWYRMSLTERDWVDKYFDDEQLENGRWNRSAKYRFKTGLATANERALDPGITVVEDIALGVWMGDGSPVELGWGGNIAQIGLGFVPFIGLGTDARDTYYTLTEVIESGGADGKLAFTFALIGWAHGVGDVAKGGKRIVVKGMSAAAAATALAAKHLADSKLLKKADDFFAKKTVVVKGPGRPRNPDGTFAKGAGGDSATAARGRQAHKDWDPGKGFEKEFTLPSGRRADAVNFEQRHVIELKPSNPKAVQKGRRQVKQYLEELQEVYGGKWTSSVETYDP